jgi:hypothetical protein
MAAPPETGLAWPTFKKTPPPPEIYVIMPPTREFGYKNRELSGLNSRREVHKTIFDCDGKGGRHNLRLYALSGH